uniref:Bm9189 n=1 Tax=Brugia malayi TaxID=6279 RepID=A0A1S0T0E7_BRUMA|nr:Bm9189 [Brugia malayi]
MEFLQKIPAKQQENQRYVTIVEDDQGISSQQEQGSTEAADKLGENVEQTSIELTIEEKLPRWVLDEVYKWKELDPDWFVSVKRKETINQICGPKNPDDARTA